MLKNILLGALGVGAIALACVQFGSKPSDTVGPLFPGSVNIATVEDSQLTTRLDAITESLAEVDRREREDRGRIEDLFKMAHTPCGLPRPQADDGGSDLVRDASERAMRGLPVSAMRKTCAVVAVLATFAACAESPLSPGTSTPFATAVAVSSGLRWPGTPNDDRTGTAHCRDCAPEPFSLKVPDGQWVQSGVPMYLEVHGVPASNDITGCHITLRLTNDDESLTWDEHDAAMPVFLLERRGFWNVACWRQDGAVASLDGYAY